MTKALKITIAALLAVQIILILLLGHYVQGMTAGRQDEILYYYIRKDKLMFEQQQLQAMADELNASLAREQQRQQELATQLTAAQQAPATVVPAPPAPKPPAPAPAPSPPPPRRVTRAS